MTWITPSQKKRMDSLEDDYPISFGQDGDKERHAI